MLKHIPLRASCFLLGALIALILQFVQTLYRGKAASNTGNAANANNDPGAKQQAVD